MWASLATQKRCQKVFTLPGYDLKFIHQKLESIFHFLKEAKDRKV